jgi:citrate lyase subunit beta/citryl-CoA lyase
VSGPRSLLFVPGNREDMLGKAPRSGADALILDLEDSVPVAEKARARDIAHDYIGLNGSRHVLYVRVNAISTGWLEADLEAIVRPGLAAVRLAMTDSAATVREVDRLIGEREARAGMPPGSVRICPSLETARGVWNAHEICAASPRVNAVSCGTAQDGDLQADLGYQWSPEGTEVLYVRSRVLLAAKAAGVVHVLDGTYARIRDEDGLRQCCETVLRLGYRGKSCIHPAQVPVVNGIFMPTARELDYYRRVIEAFDAAVARGSAATTVDGTMVDYAMVDTARRVMAWAESAARGGRGHE